MRRRMLLAVIPLGLAIPFLFAARPGQKAPIVAENHAAVEKALGYHLFAPTALPRGLEPGRNGIRQGALRVLSDYSNDEDTLIVAQERRTPERDAYNRAHFVGSAIDVNGSEGTLTTGAMGERRLTFYTPELTVVLSSSTLTDQELLTVARSMR